MQGSERSRVLVAGGSGVLGRRVVAELVSRGHEVHALVRREGTAIPLQRLGAVVHVGDLLTGLPEDTLPASVDVVVHAATAIPVGARPGRAQWMRSDRVRLDGARALLDWGEARGMRLFVLPSTVWVARPDDGAPFDERGAPNPSRADRSAADAEALIHDRAGAGGFEAAVLRFGWYYGPDAPHTLLFRDLLERRRLPIVGDGKAYWSVIHLDDAARAVSCVVHGGRGGTWHVVDDRPVEVADFLETFASLLRAPRPRKVPVWLARIVAGSYSTDFFTRSTRTSSRRFEAEFGWRPRYATGAEGLRQIVRTWNRL